MLHSIDRPFAAYGRQTPPFVMPHHDGVLLIGRDAARRKLFRYAFEGAGHFVYEAEHAYVDMPMSEVAAVAVVIAAQADVPELLFTAARRTRAWRRPLLTILDGAADMDALRQLGVHETVRADCPPRDLVIRLRRMLAAAQVVEVGPVRLDARAREVHCAGRLCSLSPREFDVLHLLMLNAGEALSRHQIQRLVWGENECTTRAIDVSVRRIRAALGDEGGVLLETLRLVGYRFAQPAR